jgi:hypothetical protein
MLFAQPGQQMMGYPFPQMMPIPGYPYNPAMQPMMSWMQQQQFAGNPAMAHAMQQQQQNR